MPTPFMLVPFLCNQGDDYHVDHDDDDAHDHDTAGLLQQRQDVNASYAEDRARQMEGLRVRGGCAYEDISDH